MAINHSTIKSTLKAIGITIFVISIALKIRQIILYGGTKPVKPPTDEGEPDGCNETYDVAEAPVAYPSIGDDPDE